jgi:hypothetical protein
LNTRWRMAALPAKHPGVTVTNQQHHDEDEAKNDDPAR